MLACQRLVIPRGAHEIWPKHRAMGSQELWRSRLLTVGCFCPAAHVQPFLVSQVSECQSSSASEALQPVGLEHPRQGTVRDVSSVSMALRHERSCAVLH